MKGTVRKDEQRGTWLYVFEYRDAEGRRHQPTRRGFATERAASAALREALRAHDTGAPVTEPSKEPMARYLARWLEHERALVAATTWKRDRHHVEADIIPAIGHIAVRALQPLHVEEVLNRALRRGLSPATVNRIRSVLHKAMRQAIRWKMVAVNPVAATDQRKVVRPTLMVPSSVGLVALQQVSIGTRWEMAMLLATTLGTRRGETLGIAWEHVDLATGRVRIERALQRIDGALVFTEPKTARARRTVVLPATALERVVRFKLAQAEALLALGVRQTPATLLVTDEKGGPQDPSGYSKAAKRFAAAVGLPGARLHDSRHGVATALMAVHPKIASAVMGHSSEAFTMATYQHLQTGHAEEAAGAIEAALYPFPVTDPVTEPVADGR